MNRLGHNPRAVLAALRAAGWAITVTARGHLKCRAPGGQIVIGARLEGPRSCPRAFWNFLRDLRRAGWTPAGVTQ